ncbi:MAG: WHG domain-containing protein [Deltaproteobacteria bacterium]|nr:WHG domain-containing protein [Deltaproteobacteria bacterium]
MACKPSPCGRWPAKSGSGYRASTGGLRGPRRSAAGGGRRGPGPPPHLYLTRGLEAGSPRERLLATGDGYLDFALEHPHDYRVMFLAWEELQIGLHAPDPQGRPSPALQLLMDRVRECRSASPPEEIQALGLMLWAQVHGLASLWVAGGGPAIMPRPHFEAMARAQVRRLVDALFPGSE